MIGGVTTSIIDARVKRGGRRRRRRQRLLRSRDLLTGGGELARGVVMVMVMMMMVRMVVLVLVLMLMLVVLIMLLLLVMTRARGYALQSWRNDMGRRLLVKLQLLLLPPVGDAGTSCRGIHRSASCPVASSLPVSKQPRSCYELHSHGRMMRRRWVRVMSGMPTRSLFPGEFLFATFFLLFFSLSLSLSLFLSLFPLPLWKGKKRDGAPPVLAPVVNGLRL